jgi:uncharacterized membrane protein (UPF0127 family)
MQKKYLPVSKKSSPEIKLFEIQLAETFFERLVGLISTSSLPESKGLWIKNCNSIHTCFMQFTIDCIFLDKDLVIKKICKQVEPWRMTWPVWSAYSVIELESGQIEKWGLVEGEVLYVGA